MGNSSSQSKKEKFKQILENELLVSMYPSPDAGVIKTTSRRPTKPAPQNVQRIILQAKPIQERNEDKVNAFDGRTQVLTPAKWPYSVHGVIASKFNNITSWGTGILIGPNIVLTAGHNLYSHKLKKYADVKSLQFLPGMNGQVLPFGLVEVEKYFVSPNYIKNEKKEDYGILVLKEPIGEVTGYFGLACLDPEELKTKKINVTGYPGDKVESKPNMYEMWGMEGTASHIDQDRGIISYMIDTEAGQSGSGVWYKEGEDYYVCGVHVSGSKFVNTATLLTRTMYQQIHRWLQEAGFKELLLKLGDRKQIGFRSEELDAECASLLMNYNMDGLACLDLSWNKIEKEGARILAQDTSWAHLLQLKLAYNNISTEGAKALAENTSWTSLSELNLTGNNIGAEGAKALAQNTAWINLSQLVLYENNIGTEGAKELAQNTSWVNLTQLSLVENKIGPEGAEALAQNAYWINLSELDLSHNNIGTEGVKGLAQNTSWTNLARLSLENINIDGEGAKALAQNISWVNLSTLGLSWNRIGTEGAIALGQNTS